MQFVYELFPVFIFLLAFKLYDIYIATIVGIIVTFLMVLFYRLFMKKWDRKQLITLAVFVVFGGMTLYFHDPIFVKWKPTVIFWVFSVFIFGSFFTHKPLMQRLMEKTFEDKGSIPYIVWKRVNFMWGVFFILLGSVNLYVAYTYSNDTWVNFKFYGISGLVFAFSILQAFYLMRFLNEPSK